MFITNLILILTKKLNYIINKYVNNPTLIFIAFLRYKLSPLGYTNLKIKYLNQSVHNQADAFLENKIRN
jgi:hypothetical protein